MVEPAAVKAVVLHLSTDLAQLWPPTVWFKTGQWVHSNNTQEQVVGRRPAIQSSNMLTTTVFIVVLL